ncbi:MAG: hypothetical protein IJY20_08320 [Clostridia bacterium]|nr:hypothetical protein [Clostridia bacterium]
MSKKKSVAKETVDPALRARELTLSTKKLARLVRECEAQTRRPRKKSAPQDEYRNGDMEE